MEKKVFIKTFGCQMNEYDTNRIFDIVKKIGFVKTENQENAECYILNTCHIRDKAKEKVYHEIGRVKKIYNKKKKPILIVAGCVAQAENEEMIRREPYIDAIVGPQSYHKINKILENIQTSNKQEETEFDAFSKFEYLEGIKNNNNKTSVFLTVQEGCDKFCHFCVVPYTRGPEYSRPFEQIIKEAEELIKNGVREITLLGQNVNAYYYSENGKEYRISNLIKRLDQYSELKRVRYTTSHPRDMTDDLIDCYSSSKKLMPFVHLPIQSGSDKILHLMNRKHKVEDYLKVYEKLININNDIKFSSDFIIGYPGETENDFNDTLKLLDKINFINSFSFIFSPRPGTVAADYKQNNIQISKNRLSKIQKLLSDIQFKINEKLNNRNIKVLIENEIIDQNKLFGRNQYLNSVIVEGNKDSIGNLIDVHIENFNRNTLFGKQKKYKIKAA